MDTRRFDIDSDIRRGRYSPTREQGVHHFRRLLGASLNGA